MKTFLFSTFTHCAVAALAAILMVKPLRLQMSTACALTLAATMLISLTRYYAGDLPKKGFFAGVAVSGLAFSLVFFVFDWAAGNIPGTPLDISSFIRYWHSPASKETLLMLAAPACLMVASSLAGYLFARLARSRPRASTPRSG